MCWKYEESYKECFDNLTGEVYGDCGDLGAASIVPFFEKEYNIKVVDRNKLCDLLFYLLSEAHEKGYIKPAEDL